MSQRFDLVSEWLQQGRDEIELMRQRNEVWSEMVRSGLFQASGTTRSASRSALTRRPLTDMSTLWGSGTRAMRSRDRARPTTRRNPMANPTVGLGGWLSAWSEPVPVLATPAQITAAVETVEFQSIASPPNETCPITQRSFAATDRVSRLRQCGHIFDPDALTRLFEYSVMCPLCRADIRNGPSDRADASASTSTGANTGITSTGAGIGASTGASTGTSTRTETIPVITQSVNNRTTIPMLSASEALGIANRLAEEITTQLQYQEADPSGNITVALEMIGPNNTIRSLNPGP